MSRQIVVSGGGGFWYGSDGLALDSFVLSLVGKTRPKVCYLATAAGDSEEFIQGFYDNLGASCQATHLPLFLPPFRSPVEALSDQDVIYVSGGSTANMLAIWRLHGIDRMLRLALASGTILYGSSAGGLCWFESGVSDSLGFDGALRPLPNGLGFLSGSHCPHFDEPSRRSAYLGMVQCGALPAGFGVDELAALHFVDGQVHQTVASSSGAGAHLVRRGDNDASTVDRLPVTRV